ncbi:MAG: AmmeMemoRadiSam system protein B [Deltaproteobacteria bacterium]|nr:AmmeMemoRadiSam system protein B [Deltaproteobacteria bacterium]
MGRPPAVAGRFYEASGPELERRVRALAATDPSVPPRPVVGAVSPHAAYEYSGAVAGRVFSRIVVPDVVVVLAPNHTGLGQPAAVGVDGPWQMPTGDIEIDAEVAWRVVGSCEHLVADDLAHATEHAIEVQVPFLQARNPAVRIVPVCLRTMSFEMCGCIGKGIARALAGIEDRVLLVASSDMSHHEPLRVATRKDRMAIERIREMDAHGLYSAVVDHHVSMCGVVPVTVMLVAARLLGARHAELIDYATTGDVSRDDSSVVGYAGLVVTKERPRHVLRSLADEEKAAARPGPQRAALEL